LARFSRGEAGRVADALERLERVALAPRQSFLNIVLVVVLVLVLDFRDASDKPSPWVHRSRFFFARPRFQLRRSENENDDEDDDENDSRNEGERGALALIGIPASRLLNSV
jgi:hypothetical protein